MTDSQDLFSVGKVVGFHGLAGELKVRPSTNSPTLLLSIEQVSIRLASGQELSGEVANVRLDKRLLFVSLAGYKDRTAVEFLMDAELLVDKDQLEPLETDEWWVTDLVGLEVYTTTGELVGAVVSIIDGGNQVLEIKSKDRLVDGTILVPFVKDLVPKVDIRAGRIEVVALPGLLEPQ
jgi:16S rRNA processing protein RimM